MVSEAIFLNESECYLIVKSQYGLTSEISNVTPFLYHIRYFKRGATGADDETSAGTTTAQ